MSSKTRLGLHQTIWTLFQNDVLEREAAQAGARPPRHASRQATTALRAKDAGAMINMMYIKSFGYDKFVCMLRFDHD